MTRLRGGLPPVMSVACALSVDTGREAAPLRHSCGTGGPPEDVER
jgi:hypothetical protein